MQKTKDFHILIVDDEEDIMEICSDAFEMEGFRVSGATNGQLALEIFHNTEIDVVISDSMMPGMTGDELLSKIRECQKSMPHFFLSTGLIDADEEEYIKKGAAGVIRKPFDAFEIVNRIKEKLAQHAA